MLLLVQEASSPWEGWVAGKTGVDRQSSLAFKGAGTETACSLEQLLDSLNSGPWVGLGQCISNTVLLDLWQLCETDDKQYNMVPLTWLLYREVEVMVVESQLSEEASKPATTG